MSDPDSFLSNPLDGQNLPPGILYLGQGYVEDDAILLVDFDALGITDKSDEGVKAYLEKNGITDPGAIFTSDISDLSDMDLNRLTAWMEEYAESNREKPSAKRINTNDDTLRQGKPVLEKIFSAVVETPEYQAYLSKTRSAISESLIAQKDTIVDWPNLSRDEKITLINDIIAQQSESYGIKPPTMKIDAQMLNDGSYNFGSNELLISESLLNETSPAELLDTISHEVSHAHQYDLAKKYSSNSSANSNEAAVGRLFHNYNHLSISPGESQNPERFALYEAQPIEIAAREIGAYTVDMLDREFALNQFGVEHVLDPNEKIEEMPKPVRRESDGPAPRRADRALTDIDLDEIEKATRPFDGNMAYDDLNLDELEKTANGFDQSEGFDLDLEQERFTRQQGRIRPGDTFGQDGRTQNPNGWKRNRGLDDPLGDGMDERQQRAMARSSLEQNAADRPPPPPVDNPPPPSDDPSRAYVSTLLDTQLTVVSTLRADDATNLAARNDAREKLLKVIDAASAGNPELLETLGMAMDGNEPLRIEIRDLPGNKANLNIGPGETIIPTFPGAHGDETGKQRPIKRTQITFEGPDGKPQQAIFAEPGRDGSTVLVIDKTSLDILSMEQNLALMRQSETMEIVMRQAIKDTLGDKADLRLANTVREGLPDDSFKPPELPKEMKLTSADPESLEFKPNENSDATVILKSSPRRNAPVAPAPSTPPGTDEYIISTDPDSIDFELNLDAEDSSPGTSEQQPGEQQPVKQASGDPSPTIDVAEAIKNQPNGEYITEDTRGPTGTRIIDAEALRQAQLGDNGGTPPPTPDADMPIRTPAGAKTTPGNAMMSFLGIPMGEAGLQQWDKLSGFQKVLTGGLLGGGTLGGIGETLNALPGLLKEAKTLPSDVKGIFNTSASTPAGAVTAAESAAATRVATNNPATRLERVSNSRVTRTLMRGGEFVAPLVAVAGGIEVGNAIMDADTRSSFSTAHDLAHGTAVTYIGANGTLGVVAPRVATRIGGTLVAPVGIALFAWDAANYGVSKINGGHTLASAMDELEGAKQDSRRIREIDTTSALINTTFPPLPREYKNLNLGVNIVNSYPQEDEEWLDDKKTYGTRFLRERIETTRERIKEAIRASDNSDTIEGMRDQDKILEQSLKEIYNLEQDGFKGYNQRLVETNQRDRAVAELVREGKLDEDFPGDMKRFTGIVRELQNQDLRMEEKQALASELNDIQQRRFGQQIETMLEGKDAQSVIAENNRLVETLNLDPITAQSLFITSPEQLENLLQNYRKADGTMVNMQADMDLTAPSLAVLLDEGRVAGGEMKIFKDEQKGAVLVVEDFEKRFEPSQNTARLEWMKAQGLKELTYTDRMPNNTSGQLQARFVMDYDSAKPYLTESAEQTLETEPFKEVIGQEVGVNVYPRGRGRYTVEDIKPVPGKENTYEMIISGYALGRGLEDKLVTDDKIRIEWKVEEMKGEWAGDVASYVTALHPAGEKPSLPEGYKPGDTDRGYKDVQLGGATQDVKVFLRDLLQDISRMPDFDINKPGPAQKEESTEMGRKPITDNLSDEMLAALGDIGQSMKRNGLGNNPEKLKPVDLDKLPPARSGVFRA